MHDQLPRRALSFADLVNGLLGKRGCTWTRLGRARVVDGLGPADLAFAIGLRPRPEDCYV